MMNPNGGIQFHNICIPEKNILKKNTPPPSPLLPIITQQPAPEQQTGALLIYIITNVPIALYQVNYAPYLILILL